MTAIAIVEGLDIYAGDGSPESRHGFSVKFVEDGLLLARWGHAVGLIRRAGGSFQFLRIGYALPSFETTEVDEIIEHLIDVVAEQLKPTHGQC